MATFLLQSAQPVKITANDLKEFAVKDLSAIATYIKGVTRASDQIKDMIVRVYGDIVRLPVADIRFIMQYQQGQARGMIAEPASWYERSVAMAARVVATPEKTVVTFPTGETVKMQSSPMPVLDDVKERVGLVWLTNFLAPLVRIKKGEFTLGVNPVLIDQAAFRALKRGGLNFLLEFVKHSFSKHIIKGVNVKVSYKGPTMIDWWHNLLGTIRFVDYVAFHTYVLRDVLESGSVQGGGWVPSVGTDKKTPPFVLVDAQNQEKLLKEEPGLRDSPYLPFKICNGDLTKKHAFVSGPPSMALAYQAIADGSKLRGGQKSGIGSMLHCLSSSGLPSLRMSRIQTQLSFLLVPGIKLDVVGLTLMDIAFFLSAKKFFKVDNDVRFVLEGSASRQAPVTYSPYVLQVRRTKTPILKFDYSPVNCSVSAEGMRSLSTSERFAAIVSDQFVRLFKDVAEGVEPDTPLYLMSHAILPSDDSWGAIEIRPPWDGFGLFVRKGSPPLRRIGSDDGKVLKEQPGTQIFSWSDWASKVVASNAFANTSFLSVPHATKYQYTNILIPSRDVKVQVELDEVKWYSDTWNDIMDTTDIMASEARYRQTGFLTNLTTDAVVTTTTTTTTVTTTAPQTDPGSSSSSSASQPLLASIAIADLGEYEY